MAYLQMELDSKSIGMATTVSIIIPEDLKANEKLKTLYLLHGYKGNHMDWLRRTSINRYVEDLRVCVVMPEANNSFYTDMANGLDYFTYIADELPSIMERMFPLSKKREDRYIAGLSMGGYGAFKVAALRPNKFSKAVSLSGAIDIRSIYHLTKSNDPKGYFFTIFGKKENQLKKNDLYPIFLKLIKEKNHPDFYMACGTEDFLFDDNEKFYDYITELGFQVYYEAAEGEHTWDFWDVYIQKSIQWLFEN